MKKTQLIFKHLLGTLIFFLVLFISAGRIDYWQAWVYLIIGLGMVLISYTILNIDTELMKERSKPGEGAKNWDKLLLIISFLVTIMMFVTAGLDSGRFNWSPYLNWSLYLLGIILTIVGQLLFLIAQKQNKFFSSVVRIQTDRGHTVCDTGLYKIVRHPAYLGSIIQSLGFPLIFGSLWSIIPVGLSIIILLARTHFEDKTLIDELVGYREYTKKTTYKIIPFFW